MWDIIYSFQPGGDMKIRTHRFSFASLLTLLLICVSTGTAAEEFSLVQHKFNFGGSEFGRDAIYVKGDRIRIDQSINGKPSQTLFYDGAKNEFIQLDTKTGTAKTFKLEEILKENYAAYFSHAFAAFYYRDKYPHLQVMEEAGKESMNGESARKYLLPPFPYSKEGGRNGNAYIWIAEATGLPVRYQLTLGQERSTIFTTWDGYTPGPQPDSLFELSRMSMEVPDIPDMQFALTNREGTRLLVTGKIADPEAAVRAVCEKSRQYPIRYLGKQESDPERDNHRQNVYNFQYTEGYLYEFQEGSAPDQSCLVAPAGFFTERKIIPVQTPSILEELPACLRSDVSRVESRYSRKVQQCSVLMIAGDELKVLALEFERRPEDILAAVLLFHGDEILSWDLPGNDDKYSVWRVDDGGKFKPNSIRVLFAFEHGSAIELGIEWLGAEGTVLQYLVPKYGKLFKYITESWYQAPI